MFLQMLGCLTVAASAWAQDTFTINGHVPGVKDGAVVRLVSLEKDTQRGEKLIETTARDGRFTLTGTVASPTFCRVEILGSGTFEDGSTYETETETRMMVENVPMTMETAHVDSLPLTYEFGRSPLEKEQNVTVIGGRAQTEYNAYRQALHAAELQAWQMDRYYMELRLARKGKQNPDSLAHYKTLLQDAERQVAMLTDDFIRSHPEASVSVYLVGQKLIEPFTLTVSEMEDWLACVGNTYDTVRLQQIRKEVETAKRYAAGQPFKDFVLVDTLKQTVKLSALCKSGRYTLVDFWASWCGPCRASIPHLKQLYAARGGKLDIISVSVDRKESDWKRAMEEEQMPWRQFTVTPEVSKQLAGLYKLTSIPFLLLIDSDGKIVTATGNPDAIDRALK